MGSDGFSRDVILSSLKETNTRFCREAPSLRLVLETTLIRCATFLLIKKSQEVLGFLQM